MRNRRLEVGSERTRYIQELAHFKPRLNLNQVEAHLGASAHLDVDGGSDMDNFTSRSSLGDEFVPMPQDRPCDHPGAALIAAYQTVATEPFMHQLRHGPDTAIQTEAKGYSLPIKRR
jgi:hypothetical protein